MGNELMQKYKQLKESVNNLGSAIVAFSGGIDSTLVLKASYDALRDKAIAVTADSPSLPRRELEEAKRIAKQIGAKHLITSTEETKNEDYLKNPNNRCYYCKSELYSKLKIVSAQLGIKNILNGTNLDDLGDYRPGLMAAGENNVISPLKDAKITKSEVREIARHLGLQTWDKPSSPCLSSRVPYGQGITLKKLSMVEEAENFLKDFGMRELRVRHFDDMARIEVNENDKRIINDNFISIQKKFNEIGFNDVTISDFKSGNLNAVANGRAEN
ncbi:ATP-dependent sacrificial sulfur transferase LarE [Candidatus Woesearchaeota archaeon]|nr:ATP-dependent sacrificial sulfur transferase LarE [Candidatus Woesearchaeota archaeon]